MLGIDAIVQLAHAAESVLCLCATERLPSNLVITMPPAVH